MYNLILSFCCIGFVFLSLIFVAVVGDLNQILVFSAAAVTGALLKVGEDLRDIAKAIREKKSDK